MNGIIRNPALKCFLFASSAPDLSCIVRFFAGLMIAKHGLMLFSAEAMTGTAGLFGNIGIPMPGLMAYVAKSAEFFGGVLLAAGALTRPASLVLTFNMIVASGTAHHFNPFEGEPAFLFLLLFAVFAMIGGGKYSVDCLLKKYFIDRSDGER
ncbi:MAG: DoxX family protein [Prevotellaceae bacterium]|jgi:putative oxidoreductase|nr:DoxX family protein [Prevotellaceae bacterium]